MECDICCAGHITLDKVVTPAREVYMPGGTAWYFAHTMASLGADRFLLIASLGKEEMEAVEQLRSRGVVVKAIESSRSVYFENIYGEDPNKRIQRVGAKADQILLEDLKGVESRIYHLGTLLADDFAADVIPELAKRGELSVDAQGFLRRVEGEEVLACEWKDKLGMLPYLNYLKANEHEMVSLTGYSNARDAARLLSEWGVTEVVITLGDEGSLIYKGKDFYEIPAYPVSRVVDPTGCGDTYMAAYLYALSQGEGTASAGRFAAHVCSEKLECSGPYIRNF